MVIEKLFPLYRNQSVFRREWQTDLKHFAVNHFLVGLILLTVNFAIHHAFGWLVNHDFQLAVQRIWFVPQLLLCILVADLSQYWTHRAYHEIPFLWKFHAVHHSAKTMDWLAGSRQHVFEIIATRVLVLAPLFVLGFSEGVINAYIIIVGFQAVFNHANVHLPWGPLKYLIVTPDFHHWHHASGRRGDRPQLRGALRIPRLSVRHRGQGAGAQAVAGEVRRGRRLHAGWLARTAGVPVPRQAAALTAGVVDGPAATIPLLSAAS